MKSINANDMKNNGISAAGEGETLINIRGNPFYVIVRLDKYETLGETELTLAMIEAEDDDKARRYVSGSVDDHIKRITK